MNKLFRNILKVYSARQYKVVVIVTVVVISVSSYAIWSMMKDHLDHLRAETNSKSQFILRSIEKEVALNVLIGDDDALYFLEQDLKDKDSTIMALSIYDAKHQLLYGVRSGYQFTDKEWLFNSENKKVYAMQKYADSSVEGAHIYIELVRSEQFLLDSVEELKTNSILFVIVLILLTNTVLFKKFYDLELSIAKEAMLKTDAELSEKKERIQRQFLANMSHELRTPLNAIIGFTKLLESTKDEGLRAGYQDILGRSSQHMKNLINDILDLSKIQEGKLELSIESFDLNEVYHSVLEILEHRMSDQVYLKTLEKSDKPLIVSGDALRLKQVMLNLLSNAIKYTKKGYVYPRLICNMVGEMYNLRFEVTDSGIGIPKGKELNLFDDFFQAHSSSLEIEGSGLGLSISKKIIELAGGKIGYNPNPNGGSVFYFEIQLPAGNPVNNEKDITVNEVDFSAYSILVAEDNEFNQVLIETILTNIKFKVVDLAFDGLEAIRMVKEKKYDLILMDIQMPKMGGVEALKEIRKMFSELPVIALTANALKGDRAVFLEEGFDGYATKPIDEERLISEMSKCLEQKGQDLSDVSVTNQDKIAVSQEEQLFIEQAILDKIGGDKNLLKELMESFQDTISNELNAVEKAIEKEDYEELSAQTNIIMPSITLLMPESSKKLLIQILDPKTSCATKQGVFRELNGKVNAFLQLAEEWITRN